MVDSFTPPWAMAGFTAGTRVASYRLVELIGRGGMAVVFKALDERLNRQVNGFGPIFPSRPQR